MVFTVHTHLNSVIQFVSVRPVKPHKVVFAHITVSEMDTHWNYERIPRSSEKVFMFFLTDIDTLVFVRQAKPH